MDAVQFCQVIQSALDRPEAVELTDRIQDYKQWDSLNLLNLISALDEHYDFALDGQLVTKETTIQNLLDLVQAKKG